MWVRTWNFVLNILLFLYSKPMPSFFEIVIINFWRCQHKAEFSEEVVSVWSIPDFSPWVSQILWLWRDVRSRARIFLDRLGLHLLLIMESELMPSDCVVRVTTKLRSGKITYKTYKERFPCFSMSICWLCCLWLMQLLHILIYDFLGPLPANLHVTAFA